MSKNEASQYVRDLRNAGDKVSVVIGDCQMMIYHLNDGSVEVLTLEQSDDCVASTITSWRELS